MSEFESMARLQCKINGVRYGRHKVDEEGNLVIHAKMGLDAPLDFIHLTVNLDGIDIIH